MRVLGAVALVTGASSGVGRAVAMALAEAGAELVLHGRDRARLAEVADCTGGLPLLADLSSADGVEQLAERALALRGRLDVLVASAGQGWAGPFTDMDSTDLDALVGLNLLAPMRLTRVLLPGMLERGHGHLALVGSVAGRTGVAGEAVYAASKAGLDGFAESLRLELSGSGVSVSLTLPGAVDTPFFANRGRPYDRTVPKPVPADVVAAAVLDAVRRDRAEVWTPGWLRVASAVRAVAPGAYRRLSARYGEPVRSRAEVPR